MLPTLTRVRPAPAVAPRAQGAAPRGLASCARFRFQQLSSAGSSPAVRRGLSRAHLVVDPSPRAASCSLPWKGLGRTFSGWKSSKQL